MAQHPIQAYKGPSMAVVRISIPGGNATADNPPSTTLKHPNEAPPQPYLPKGADHSITNLPTTKFLEKIVMIGKNPNRKNGRTAIHKRWRLLSAQVVSCCVYKIKNYAARAMQHSFNVWTTGLIRAFTSFYQRVLWLILKNPFSRYIQPGPGDAKRNAAINNRVRPARPAGNDRPPVLPNKPNVRRR